MITGRTRVFAILGDPVSHSISPEMHNAAFRALGLDAVYVPIRCAGPDLAATMRALAMAGGGGNVTVPHKRLAALLVTPVDNTPLLGCNTFWAEGDKLMGDETDSVGIGKAWEHLGRPPGDWLILGTGGSASAAARAAVHRGAGVVVRSRSVERAAAFEAEVLALGGRAGAAPFGMVVNATPLGLATSDPMPLSIEQIPDGAAVLDLVYARGQTVWARAAAAAGHQAVDGAEVLLWQGAAAFERWFGGVSTPIDVMRAAVVRALR